jgi:hypothetical protein
MVEVAVFEADGKKTPTVTNAQSRLLYWPNPKKAA